MLHCPLCGKAFENLQGVKTHFRIVHATNGTCPICGKRFSYLCMHYLMQAQLTGETIYKALYILTVKSRTRQRYYKLWLDEVIEFLRGGCYGGGSNLGREDQTG